MRIIGGSDFYDSAMAFGRDETILFKRNEGRTLTGHEAHDDFGIPRRQPGFELHLNGNKPRALARQYWPLMRRTTQELQIDHTRFVFTPMHVVFCGVLYSGMTAETTQSWPHKQSTTRFWKGDAFLEFCQSHGIAISNPDSSVLPDTRLDARGINQSVEVRLESLEDYFKPLPIPREKLGAIIAERITILTRNPGTWNRDTVWTINGSELSELGFAKALDPHTAFQEIAMFIGGVLGAENPNIVEITDDRVKAEKHGFHHPTSFRRGKAGK